MGIIHTMQVTPKQLEDFGPFIPVEIHALSGSGQQIPAPVKGEALIDTGATITAIDPSVATRLNLTPTKTLPVQGHKGLVNSNYYQVKFVLPDKSVFDPLLVNEFSLLGYPAPGSGQFIALIGRDILRHSIFVYDGDIGYFSLSVDAT